MSERASASKVLLVEFMANSGACCPQHGNLVESRLDLRSLHRHDFIAPSDVFVLSGIRYQQQVMNFSLVLK